LKRNFDSYNAQKICEVLGSLLVVTVISSPSIDPSGLLERIPNAEAHSIDTNVDSHFVVDCLARAFKNNAGDLSDSFHEKPFQFDMEFTVASQDFVALDNVIPYEVLSWPNEFDVIEECNSAELLLP